MSDRDNLVAARDLIRNLYASDSRAVRQAAYLISDLIYVTLKRSMNPAQRAAYEQELRRLYEQLKAGDDTRLV